MAIEHNTFAEACYEMNSIEELEDSISNPDQTDMATWVLTEKEYCEQINIALNELKSENN